MPEHILIAKGIRSGAYIGGKCMTEKIIAAVGKPSVFYKNKFLKHFVSGIKKDRYLYIMLIPVLAYFIIFKYIPMYGVTIAFKDFRPLDGILGSPWTSQYGMKHFVDFFNSYYFVRVLKNTLLLNIFGLLWSFPIPIIFALLLNELNDGLFKRGVQTISYLPHFISTVILVGIMMILLSPNDGIINQAINHYGGESINFFNEPSWFRTIFIGSGIWQEFGWGAIIYIATISSIDPQLYEAAHIDGATRLQRVLHITLPGILPTISILLVLSIASIMNSNVEKILVMYQPSTYEVSDVIGTFVYRRGIMQSDFSFATAVDLFNSVINFILLITANRLNGKLTNTSLF
jgi:putative aldouronate transport system permease protein